MMEERNQQVRPEDSGADAATGPDRLYVGDLPVAHPDTAHGPADPALPDNQAQREAAAFQAPAQPPADRGAPQVAPDALSQDPASRVDGRPERRKQKRDYVPARQPAPVVRLVLSVMPADVRKAFEPRRHLALFEEEPPAPTSDLKDRRVDVLLALHGTVRESIERWEDRMFQAFGLATAAILSVLAVYLEHPAELNARRLLVAALVSTFGSLAAVYFWRAADAHSDNGALLVKVEAALGLCEVGMYLEDKPFVGWTGVWVPDRRAPVLFTALVVVTFFAALVILLFPVSAS
jgi:hypothetical protein